MTLFERVLVPLDGSERSAAILGQLGSLLEHVGELVLLRVSEPPEVPALDNPVSGQTVTVDRDAMAAALRAELDALAAELTDRGVRARSLVTTGDPTEQICQVAASESATLIALTTHGRTGLRRAICGSVAESLLRCTTTPVLICPSFVKRDGELHPATRAPLEIAHVLTPIDDSVESLDVAPHAVALARALRAKLTVLTVHASGNEAAARDLLARAADHLTIDGKPPLPQLRQGQPAEQIVAMVDEDKADLIAMATHGRSGPALWLHGSVADKVLRATARPCLLVRRDDA